MTPPARRVQEGVSTRGANQMEVTSAGSGFLLQVVGVLLFATAALLVWVGLGAVHASRDMSARSGLDYETFLQALDDLIVGAGDSSLLRFDVVEEPVSRHRTVTFDTLTILADVGAFPAFDRAGFLYDQVQVYNRFQRDRLDLARSLPEWWDRLKGFNPSIFRGQRRPDGALGLARAPVAWSLRVRSPLEGDWDGEIRAADVTRGLGLMSPGVEIPLRTPSSLLLPLGGRSQLCEFVPSPPEVRVYCLSEERIAQATLRLESGGRARRWARAGWADLWVDGERVTSGDSVELREGSLLRLEPLEPVVFGDYWEGILSSKQWINGRLRRRSELPPPLDVLAALGSGSTVAGGGVESDAFLTVTVRAEASVELTRRLRSFLQEEVPLPLDFATAVIARIPDGEIVALGEVGDRTNRGRSALLERVAPGSAVKPLLAAAILFERPELASMTIQARTGSVSSVLGMPRVSPRRMFTTTLNCPPPEGGRVDLRYFLRCSNNEYAASLVVAGLAETGVPGSTWRGAAELHLEGGRVARTALLRSPLSEGLSELFDVPTDPAIADARGRSRRVWEGGRFSDGSPFIVPFELLPSESRPALLAPGSEEGTELGLLYRYAYGAWENQWTLLDLTNSFARVVSDRRIQMSFIPSAAASGASASPASDPESLGMGRQPWYPEFLAGLQGVGVDGTASGLRSAWRDSGLPATLFAKTGTLNEEGEPTPSDDLFAKSLLFAVGESAGGSGDPLECGLVGGLYIRFSEGPSSGNLPSYQVAFALDHLGDFLRDHWEEFGACGGGEVEVGPGRAGNASRGGRLRPGG